MNDPQSYQGSEMDHSTEGVLIYAGFIFDIPAHYRGRGSSVRELLDMASDLDPEKPLKWVSIARYNAVCSWIEDKLGHASIRRAGVAIGERVHANFIAAGAIDDKTSPVDMMRALKKSADEMIQDPLNRGFDVIETKEKNCLIMRRTQTFNCILQEGLIETLLRRSHAKIPNVLHSKCTHNGDAFCEYTLRWFER